MFKLFVYGSLRSGFKNPAYEYISRYFELVGEGLVRGKLYDMGTYPAGVPSDQDRFIKGELYQIRNEHEFGWAIGQLDDYEGVSVAFDEVQLYRRVVTEVLINNQVTKAWIYWYNGDIRNKPEVESGDILQYIQGKKSNNP